MRFPLKTLAAAPLAAAVLALPVLAQTTGSSTAPAGGAAGTTSTAPAMTAAATALQTRLAENFDRLFLLKAVQGNMAEVMTGQLALRKSRNESVRRLAQMLIQEHGQANQELLPILRAKGLPLPRTVGAMHAATYDHLNRLNRERFDQAFMAAQTEAHENTITLYQQELAQGRDEDSRAFATKYLPPILGHTAMIYAIAGQVGAPGSAERMAALRTSAAEMNTMMGGMGMSGMSMSGTSTSTTR